MHDLTQEHLYEEGLEVIGRGDYEEITGFIQKLREQEWYTLADTLETEWKQISKDQELKDESDETTLRSMLYGN